MFLEAHCSLLGTDNVHGQISVHIFAPNGGYCLYIELRPASLALRKPAWTDHFINKYNCIIYSGETNTSSSNSHKAPFRDFTSSTTGLMYCSSDSVAAILQDFPSGLKKPGVNVYTRVST